MRSSPERGQQAPIFAVISDIRNSNIEQKVKTLILRNIMPEKILKDPENKKLVK
jgi:hypothetical protein